VSLAALAASSRTGSLGTLQQPGSDLLLLASLPPRPPRDDLDGVEFCGRCHAILCLVETARGVGQADKKSTVLEALAKAAGTVALLVMWTPDAAFRCACGQHSAITTQGPARVSRPESFCLLTASELAAWFEELRRHHLRACPAAPRAA
jgi:hypothetical protein